MAGKLIVRPEYSEMIKPYVGGSLIKILIGQRRVGKSFILMQLMQDISKDYPENYIIYINKEDYQFDSIKNYSDLIQFVNSKITEERTTALFIDEVQEIQGFEKALRHFQNSGNFDIYCTGSNANLLSGELATLLAGRYIRFRVNSLSYMEFLKFHQLEDKQESLNKFMKFGGMPHLINLKNEERVYYEYLRNVFDSIVLRDIVARYNIRNVNFLRDLLKFLADNTGSLFSAKKISDYLKSQNINIQSKTILEYLDYIESVFFVDRVKRAEIGGKKIFEIGEKYYFEDLGMRHGLVPFNQKDINKVLENLVYHHLKLNRYEIYIGKSGDKEIDFIAEKPGKKIYIQVAYLIPDDKVHDREFGNLLEIEDNYTKCVVSMDETASGNYKGIEHWNIRKFLMEFK
jgi:predicted AAA+ superfamily ATPase